MSIDYISYYCVQLLIFRNYFFMINKLNQFILNNISKVEMLGVIMRIISFSLVSWLGSESPIDAIILSWCAILRKDRAYSLLNSFWILVGVVGILRATGVI